MIAAIKFAEAAALAPPLGWAGAVTAIAVTAGFVSQIVLTVLVRMEAKRAAEKAATEVKEVKATLQQTTAKHEEAAAVQSVKLDEVHGIVNSQRTAMETRIGQLLKEVQDLKVLAAVKETTAAVKETTGAIQAASESKEHGS